MHTYHIKICRYGKKTWQKASALLFLVSSHGYYTHGLYKLIIEPVAKQLEWMLGMFCAKESGLLQSHGSIFIAQYVDKNPHYFLAFLWVKVDIPLVRASSHGVSRGSAKQSVSGYIQCWITFTSIHF